MASGIDSVATVDIHSEARRELEQSALWYEEQIPGLGDEFLAEVDRAIATIAQHPERWPFIKGQARRCPVHRFPYGVVYTYHQGGVRVVSVMHLHRRPRYWGDSLA
jgi:hypothetical protein